MHGTVPPPRQTPFLTILLAYPKVLPRREITTGGHDASTPPTVF